MAYSRLTLGLVGSWVAGTSAFACGGGYVEVPPTLDYYLQRLPAKSIVQVLNDAGQAPHMSRDMVVDQNQLTADFAAGPSPQLVAKLDDLLKKARQNYFGPEDVNLLQDFRDLAAGKGTAAEVSDYVQWRFMHRYIFAPPKRDVWPQPAKVTDSTPSEIDPKLKASSPALMSNWLYLKGAFLFKQVNDTDSEKYFDRVLKEFPDSPRAESALFMKARCQLSQSVQDFYSSEKPITPAETTDHQSEARDLFEQYLTKYPNGRYRNDVMGWLGGIAYRTGNGALAMTYYVQQIEDADHPENFRPAVIMIEKCLTETTKADEASLDQIAQHPSLALALTYVAVNGTMSFEAGGESGDQPDASEIKVRHRLLPKLAAAVLKHKELYKGDAGQDRYLAILAHAASDQGEQGQALDLVRVAGHENDDVAFVHALALQRSGKFDEAVSAYRHLLEKYPQSPLASGARYRLGLALHDEKKDGEALLELAALNSNRLPLRAAPPPLPAAPGAMPTPDQDDDDANSGYQLESPGLDYSGATDSAVQQTLDTLLNFSPVESLAAALQGTDPERAELRNDLRQVLQERCLAAEDYAGAARYADSDTLKKKFQDLALSAPRLRITSGSQAARDDFQVADYWATQAKLFVAMPLDSSEARENLFGEGTMAGVQRRTNGHVLGFSDPEAALDSRSQWQHAIWWWNRTAEADHSGRLAPVSLWNAIEAQRQMVDTSPYTQQRAVESNQAAQVKDSYTQLMNQYADSDEARVKAAYWTFPSADELKKAARYRGDGAMAFPGISTLNDGGGDWRTALGSSLDSNYETSKPWTDLCNQVAKFPEASKSMDAAAFSTAVDGFLATARPLVSSMRSIALINVLEDLQMVAKVPGLDPATRAAYAQFRLSRAATAAGNDLYNTDLDQRQPFTDSVDDLRQLPSAATIADFLDYLDVAATANREVSFTLDGKEKDGQPITYNAHDYARLAADSAAFLQKYPKSLKREAAALLHLRALVYIARPRFDPAGTDWPAANRWEGDDGVRALVQGTFDAKAFDESLAAYEKEFPATAYADSIVSLKVDAALLQKKWGDALDGLIALHDPAKKPAFQNQVAVELSGIFNQLDNTENRHAVLVEILKRPVARDLLASYLKQGGVPYLRDYLTGQLKVATTQ